MNFALLGLIFSIIVSVSSAGIFIGGLAMAVKYIEKWLTRIEAKQDKYNGFLERLVKTEQSTASSHHRIDELAKRLE